MHPRLLQSRRCRCYRCPRHQTSRSTLPAPSCHRRRTGADAAPVAARRACRRRRHRRGGRRHGRRAAAVAHQPPGQQPLGMCQRSDGGAAGAGAWPSPGLVIHWFRKRHNCVYHVCKDYVAMYLCLPCMQGLCSKRWHNASMTGSQCWPPGQELAGPLRLGRSFFTFKDKGVFVLTMCAKIVWSLC